METENREIFLFLECFENHVCNSSLELFSAAKAVCSVTGGRITALILAEAPEAAAQVAAACGADRVICVKDPRFSVYSTVQFTHALHELIKKYQPAAVMISASHNGKDLAPRLARRLGTGITANCTELSVEKETGLISWNMPAPGGIMATILCPDTLPQMGTICPGAFRKPELDPAHAAEVVYEAISPCEADGVVRLAQFLESKSAELDIADADIIVAGGRGMGSAENFELVTTLAKKLGAAVGASRAAVDSGWATQKNLIGQTGRLVRPKLYIACGISGALQHVVGIADAGCIVAINNDPAAPIFDLADYALVGNVKEILPALIELLSGAADA